MPSAVEVLTAPSPELLVELRAFWDTAFGDRFDDHDAAHALGGVHVVARVDGRVVSHASAVPRLVRFGPGEWTEIGYVEAVATEPSEQRRGHGRRVMQQLQLEIASRWSLAMLSTGRATGFYERLGWERWRGASYTLTDAGPVADGEHGGLMVLRCDAAALPDLALDVTCEDRPGDAW